MRWRHDWTVCLAAALSWFVLACAPESGASSNSDRIVPLAEQGDAGVSPTIPDIAVDYVEWDTTDAADGAVEPGEQFFALGRNVTARNTPAFFTSLADGASLDVELGPQGLWMVVLAFKTRGIFETPVYIIGEIEVAGQRQGKLELASQPLLAGGDEFFYYYNFFLVVADPSVGGQPALVSMQVFDELGNGAKQSYRVQLTGGL